MQSAVSVSEDALPTNITDDHAASSGILYSSEGERVLMIVLTCLVGLVSLLGQLLILITIVSTQSLHNAHFFILASTCVGDIIITASTSILWLLALILGELDLLFCSITSMLGVSCFFSLHLLGGIFALERYFFFCKPMRYSLLFSPVRVAVSVAAFFLLPAVYLAPNVTNRAFQSVSMICEVTPSLQLTVTNSLLFRLFPLAVILFSLHGIWKITKSSRIAPAMPSNQKSDDLTPFAKQARSAMRMVLLVSGTFWLAYIPGVVVRVATIQIGYTIEEVNMRQSFALAIMFRVNMYMYTLLPSVLNPIIYLVSRKDLWKAVLQLLHLRSNNIRGTGINAQGQIYHTRM